MISNVHCTFFTTLFIADKICTVFFSEAMLETQSAENNPEKNPAYVEVLGASESTLGSDSGVETGFNIKNNVFLYINDVQRNNKSIQLYLEITVIKYMH